MYAVEVRDHIMIAHSFKGELFGPAQALHGATFVVDVAFFRETLTPDEVVVDIGRAHDALKSDAQAAELPQPRRAAAVQGQQHHHRVPLPPHLRRHGRGGRAGALGPGSEGIARIRVTLHESHRGARLVRGPVWSRCVSEVVFAIPGDLDAPTGGYAYDRQLLALLPRSGCGGDGTSRLPGGFPDPSAGRISPRRRGLLGDARGAVLLIDGLAFGAMPANCSSGLRAPFVALVHHPLGLESGLSPARRARLFAREARRLPRADHVIVDEPDDGAAAGGRLRCSAREDSPSRSPAPSRRRAVAGHWLAGPAPVPSAPSRRARATMCWRARSAPCGIAMAADDCRRDRPRSGSRRRSRRHRGRDSPAGIDLVGAVASALAAALRRRRRLRLASLYEGYGMALAEALARGLPIVASTGGAAAETVPDAAASRCRRAMPRRLPRRSPTDRRRAAARAALADAAWAAGQTLPRWADSAAAGGRCPAGGRRHERLQRRLARPARARRSPRPQRRDPRRAARSSSPAATATVVDLGCGTGSNLRALAPPCPRRQSWRLVDRDPALLAPRASGSPPGRTRRGGCRAPPAEGRHATSRASSRPISRQASRGSRR